MDYIQHTKAKREVVEELILYKKRKGFQRKNFPASLELIKLRRQSWKTASEEERRKMSREVKNATVADKRTYLEEICTAVETKFNNNNSHQAYRTMNMFQRNEINFGRITKDGQVNTVSMENKLKYCGNISVKPKSI
eukprot:snap_masked-scaffold_44-processed-gene-1.24-mRNA-1 protein AED:1.00 eAED:1.00 QI:0/-1/0/0/-1/1/1/0/136